jgi:hypothetical protein
VVLRSSSRNSSSSGPTAARSILTSKLILTGYIIER